MNPQIFYRVNIRTLVSISTEYQQLWCSCMVTRTYINKINVRIIILILFVIKLIRINRVNKTKFFNACCQFILKISKYTSLVIISSKILITPTPLLDTQPHTILDSFLNFIVGIWFLFSSGVRLLRETFCGPLW